MENIPILLQSEEKQFDNKPLIWVLFAHYDLTCEKAVYVFFSL